MVADMDDYAKMEYDGYLQEKACIEITGHPDGDFDSGIECDFCYHPLWRYGEIPLYEVDCDGKTITVCAHKKDFDKAGVVIEMNYCPKCGRKL